MTNKKRKKDGRKWNTISKKQETTIKSTANVKKNTRSRIKRKGQSQNDKTFSKINDRHQMKNSGGSANTKQVKYHPLKSIITHIIFKLQNIKD